MLARSFTRCVIVSAALLLLTVAAPVCAGTIEGYVYTPFGTVQSAVSISAARVGNFYPAGFGWAASWEAAPVGWYQINNLAPGTYQMLFHEKDQWPRAIVTGVNVLASGKTFVDKKVYDRDHMTGIVWGDGVRRETWAQSFVATGTSLTMVSLNEAIEFGPITEITIHEGGPDGPQIGASKLIPTIVVNATAAYWNHGDVPLVPGQTYCVKFYVPEEGMLPFLGGGRILGGRAFPEGRTWREGVLIDDPIKMTVCQDDDGIFTVVNTRKRRSDVPALAFKSVTRVGQTFVARGSSLLSASLLVGSTGGVKLNASVHTDPGVNGTGGTMVGYGKNIAPVDWNYYSGTVWAPGEVPLVDGQSYYLKIERSDGQPFTIYYVGTDDYSGGQLYLDGSPWPGAELSTTITCEAYPGSLAVETVGISNVSVLRGTDSATISWQTSVDTSTNYVQWGDSLPYTQTANGSPGGVTHMVTLNGLTPNTQYHFRVVGKAAGKRDGLARDLVFVTEPSTSNLLVNPGFETGAPAPWVLQSISGSTEIRNYPVNGAGEFFGARAHSGNYMVGAAVNGSSACKGVAYQQVAVTPGRQLNFRAWGWSWQSDNIGAFMGFTARVRAGIDPTGGTNYASPNVKWSPFVVCQDLFSADRKGAWAEAWVRAVADSTTATVFLEGGAESAMAWTVFAVDDAVLTQLDPTQVAEIKDLAGLVDGSFVEISDLVVTASAEQAGAVYVEALDRAAGVRVESSSVVATAEKVKVTGFKNTLATGEVCVADAVCTFLDYEDEIEPYATLISNLSNKAPRTVGMLMKVSGQITWDDSLNFWITDGSTGQKLRLDARNLSFWPDHLSFYSVAGVISLEGSSPAEATAVIIPRGDGDLVLVKI